MEYVLKAFYVPEGYLKKVWAGPQWLAVHLHDHFIPHARNNYHPHIFSQRMTALLSALLVTIKIFTLASITLGPIAPAYSSAISVANIISLTNQSRNQYNLPALTENQLLDQAAQAKANDMLAKGYFAHVTPTGQTPWDFITAAGYNYITAGENLAVNFTQAEDVETAWMNSPDHKANIINRNYQDIGIGISQGQYQGHLATFVVQMFGTQANEKIALTSAPTPVQTQAVPPPQSQPLPVLSKGTVKSAQTSNLAPVPTPVSPQPIALTNPQANYVDNQLIVSTQASPNVIKIIARYGSEGFMLAPGPNGQWQGTANLSDLANSNGALLLQAYDIFGNSQNIQVADFAASTPANYSLMPQAKNNQISLFGLQFDPQAAEQRFYAIFIAAMLTCLIVAIAVKRRVQHVNLVANAAFMVLLACIFWVGH